MLPRPKRFALIKLNHFLGIVETLGAGLQTPPRLKSWVRTQVASSMQPRLKLWLTLFNNHCYTIFQ